MARLDFAHDFTKGLTRGMELAAGAPAELWRLVPVGHKELRSKKGFVDHQIGVLRISDRKAAVHRLQSVRQLIANCGRGLFISFFQRCGSIWMEMSCASKRSSSKLSIVSAIS